MHPPVCLLGNCGVRAWGQARCEGVVPQGASARQSHERAAPPGESDVLVCRVCLFDFLFVGWSSLDLKKAILLAGFHVRNGSIWLVSSLCNKRARTRTRTRTRTHTHTHTHTHSHSHSPPACTVRLQAADEMFASRNAAGLPENVIDLHGLHVQEALSYLEVRTLSLSSSSSVDQQHQVVVSVQLVSSVCSLQDSQSAKLSSCRLQAANLSGG
jgi:hypothetical protein